MMMARPTKSRRSAGKVNCGRVAEVECKSNHRDKLIGYLSLSAAVVVLLALALSIDFQGSKSNVTGSATSVKYYGLSDELILTQAPNVLQTSLHFSLPTLKEIADIHNGKAKAALVAEEISQQIDFTEGIAQLYEKDPIVAPDSIVMDRVRQAAAKERSNFQAKTDCIMRLGDDFQNRYNFDVFMVSELKYQQCPKSSADKNFAYLKHSFYNQEGNRFVCSQGDATLFAVDMTTGEFSDRC